MELIIHTDLKQGTQEWHDLRLGKITGSCFHKLLGTPTAREKYLYDKASEIITDCKSDGDDYNTNKYMRMHLARGCDHESNAREMYSDSELISVQEVGLIQLNDYVACSPDGLVNEDGMIEIKVPDSNNYLKSVLEIAREGETAIQKEHYLQMQFNMYVCLRSWCDYILYNPKHVDVGTGIFVYRVKQDLGLLNQISKILDESVKIIEKYVQEYKDVFSKLNRSVIYNEILVKEIKG